MMAARAITTILRLRRLAHSCIVVMALAAIMRGGGLMAGIGVGHLCFRNQNPSTSQFASIQIMNSIKGSVQGIDSGVEFNFALGGEGHEFHQVVVATHEIAD